MSPQIASLIWCIITLVAFIWLFLTVNFQMCIQMACLRGCIITLAAFVWLFSTVRFKMCSQIACKRRGIVTLVALVWLFSTVRFQMSPMLPNASQSVTLIMVRHGERQKGWRRQLFTTMCLPKLGPAPQINPHMICYTSKSTGLIEFSQNVNIFHRLFAISLSPNYCHSMPPTILITSLSTTSLLLADFFLIHNLADLFKN